MKNSQVAVLCGAILAGALIVAAHQRLAGALGARRRAQAAAAPAGAGRRGAWSSRMMPKAKGDPYFVSCRAGAEEAAQELGVELIWDGPTGLDAARQNELVENWITRRSTRSRSRSRTAPASRRCCARRARAASRCSTWDADAEPDARDFFVNQATAEGIAQHADRRSGAAAGRQGRLRDHHRRAQRREPERVDRVHQQAPRGQASRPDAGDDPAERRRPRQGVRRDADDDEGVSVREAGDGDLRARGARRRRSRPPGRPHATST